MISALLLAAGCGGGSSSTQAPSVEQARPFANGFVRRLVVGGRWEPVADDVAPLLRGELRRFQQTIERDGVRHVVGAGALRRDCPPNRVVDAGKECFAYRLRGTQVVPVEGAKRIDARFRLWVAYDDGSWQVINYDYEVLPG